MANFQLRALRKAARILGGEERLRALLDAPPGAFARWMQGAEPVPTPVFLMMVDVRFAYQRATVFEWRCRQAWHVAAAGGGHPMRADVAARFGEIFNQVAFPGLFEAMARRELRADPSILQE